MRKLTNLLLSGCLAFGLGLSSYGCAKRNLGFGKDYVNLPEGYKTTETAFPTLCTLAGIHAGTVKLGFIKKDGVITGKAITDGYYNMTKDPKSMVRISEVADKNKDKIIDYTEATGLEMAIYGMLLEFYFKNNESFTPQKLYK